MHEGKRLLAYHNSVQHDSTVRQELLSLSGQVRPSGQCKLVSSKRTVIGTKPIVNRIYSVKCIDTMMASL